MKFEWYERTLAPAGDFWILNYWMNKLFGK
jgi:hypothetical protein